MIELECAASPPPRPPTRVVIGRGVARSVLADEDPARTFLIVDEALAEPFADRLPRHVARFDTAGGEACKTFATAEAALRVMAAVPLDRGAVVVAFGGGTIGDLGGLVASLYVRGVDLVMVPTTLLAMVDSSVGGKTAINLPEGKNLTGTFWPAREVLVDPEFLATLSDDEYRSGLGEVVKMAIGLDAELFELLRTRRDEIVGRDAGVLERAIELAIAAKIRVVDADPRESGTRRLLNLGHTLGHALEAASGYARPHGVAVAEGIHWVLDLAERRGAIDASAANACRSLLTDFGFEPPDVRDFDALTAFVARDKKVEAGRLHAVLPTGIGTSVAVPMTVDEFMAGA